MVYLDDLIVFSKDAMDHKQDLDQVLQTLAKYNLKISKQKCQWFQEEVKFLGFLVSGNGIRPDPIKIQAIKQWPTPKTVKEIQRFLGFCAFYHRFLANLSETATPLYHLLKKENAFHWSTEANTAFQQLKDKVMTLPTLAYRDPNTTYDLHTDASTFGLGAALVQLGRPIAFASSREELFNNRIRMPRYRVVP